MLEAVETVPLANTTSAGVVVDNLGGGGKDGTGGNYMKSAVWYRLSPKMDGCTYTWVYREEGGETGKGG